ncbi:MAG: hypothetical protein D4R77_00500 [Planctomycetaceae bacterium]|nr:MAG: hypothetical protein D4R77_00500 [Planctomycetaceae bacterium]
MRDKFDAGSKILSRSNRTTRSVFSAVIFLRFDHGPFVFSFKIFMRLLYEDTVFRYNACAFIFL